MTPYISSTSELVLTGDFIVSKVILVGGTANSSVILNNALTAGTDNRIELKALANDSKVTDFGKEGVRFTTGIFNTIAGSGAKVYIYVK